MTTSPWWREKVTVYYYNWYTSSSLCAGSKFYFFSEVRTFIFSSLIYGIGTFIIVNPPRDFLTVIDLDNNGYSGVPNL